MTKGDHIWYWIQQADHDFAIAETLALSEKYDVALFFGHLTLEKALKAAWVRDNEPNVPPKTHNLVYLIEHTKLMPTDDTLNLLRKVNEFNIEARYPDYKLSFYKLSTKEFAGPFLTKIKETYAWLRSELER